MPKYSSDQVVRGIEYFTSEFLCEPFQLDLDKPLHNYLSKFEDQGECSLMFLQQLAAYFKFDLSEHRALGWLKLQKGPANTHCACGKTIRDPLTKKTGRDLVQLIIRRSECPDFSPRNLLGHRCKSAGCFLGMSALINPKTRFAPSTSIREILSPWEYIDLVCRLSWIFDEAELRQHATLSRNVIDKVSCICFVAIPIASGLIATMLAKTLPAALCWTLAPLLAILGFVACISIRDRLKRCQNMEMAPDIYSFRDLTNAVMASR